MNYSDYIVRSATLENRADHDGVIDVRSMVAMYRDISAKTIITGFVYVSENGRAMHPRQAGIVTEGQAEAWKTFVSELREERKGVTLLMQLAHTGRQTTRPGAIGASSVKCTYFKNKVRPMTGEDIRQVIEDFRRAAMHAQQAGFDGVQVHAAHGYLIHQFLSPHTNKRKDRYRDGVLLLEEILVSIRGACGPDFKVWAKVSHGDDRGMSVERMIPVLKRIEGMVDAVEVSYGTMEYALNIIRGRIPIDWVLKVNPLFNRHSVWMKQLWKKFVYPSFKKRFIPFSFNYNLEAALKIKEVISTPVIVTGGIRKGADIEEIIHSGLEGVSLSRPFLREPGLVHAMNPGWISRCSNCNLCTVYCDTERSTYCHLSQRKRPS